MTRSQPARISVVATCSALLVALLVLVAPPASAQTATTEAPAEEVTSTTEAPETSNDEGSDPAEDSGVDRRWEAITALGAGLLAVGAVLVFIAKDRKIAYGLLERLATAGGNVAITTPHVPAIAAALPSFSLVGPTVAATGQELTFEAVGPTPAAVTWSVTPSAGVVGVPTSPASSMTITVANAGRYTVQADDGTGGLAAVSLIVVPARSDAEIPFLGAGWGTVVIGLSVASVTAALGLVEAIEGETVATVLGALVGFAVTKSVGEGGQ